MQIVLTDIDKISIIMAIITIIPILLLIFKIILIVKYFQIAKDLREIKNSLKETNENSLLLRKNLIDIKTIINK